MARIPWLPVRRGRGRSGCRSRSTHRQRRVESGPRTAGPVRQTIIRGLEHTPDSVVKNRIVYREGQRFDAAKLEQTQGRLYQLPFMSSVRLDYQRRGKPEITDVTIALTEAPRHEMRVGVGGAVEGGFDPSEIRLQIRQRTDYLIRRFLHPLDTLRLEARPAWQWLLAQDRQGPTGEAIATYQRIDLFAPLLTGRVSVGFIRDEFESYGQNGPTVRLGMDRPFLGDQLHLSLAWRFLYLWFFEQDDVLSLPLGPGGITAAEEIGLIEPYRLGALEQTIAFDRRDNSLSPRRGVFAQLSLVEGSKVLGGEFPFVRAGLDVRGYLSLGSRLVLAARSSYGRTFSRHHLPVTERFFDGGANGHRGFAFRELSPFVTGVVGEGDEAETRTSSIGGEESFLASGELRVDVAHIKSYPLGVVGFVDAGDVARNVGELDMGHLHWAAGLGLRYDVLVALRLDLAMRLNRHDGVDDPEPGDRFAFHLSLGQAF